MTEINPLKKELLNAYLTGTMNDAQKGEFEAETGFLSNW